MGAPENPPAFPPAIAITEAGDIYPGNDGMTLRDWFAGQALSGILASEGPETVAAGFYKSEWAAERSYEIADAMLLQRQNP